MDLWFRALGLGGGGGRGGVQGLGFSQNSSRCVARLVTLKKGSHIAGIRVLGYMRFLEASSNYKGIHLTNPKPYFCEQLGGWAPLVFDINSCMGSCVPIPKQSGQ